MAKVILSIDEVVLLKTCILDEIYKLKGKKENANTIWELKKLMDKLGDYSYGCPEKTVEIEEK